MTPLRDRLARAKALPRRKLVGAGIVALVLVGFVVLGGLSTCGGSDPDDPTLALTVEQVTDEALPGYCAEECGRWMVQSPYWFEVEASDAQVAELRSAGWTVNGVPAEPQAVQESHGGDGSTGVGDVFPWWSWPLMLVLFVGLLLFGKSLTNGRPG